VQLAKDLAPLDPAQRARLTDALEHWLEGRLAPLAPLRALEEAAKDPEAGTEVRALLLTLIDRHGTVRREEAGLAVIPKEKRPLLRRLGVTIGALDVFVAALLKPAPRQLLHDLGIDRRVVNARMEAVIAGDGPLPAGYCRAGNQMVRIDMAEKLFRAAHEQRAKGADKADQKSGGRSFAMDGALATSMGLLPDNFVKLMREAGFRANEPRLLAAGAFGPPAPRVWSWRPPRKDQAPPREERSRGTPRPPRHDKSAGGRAEGAGAASGRSARSAGKRDRPAPVERKRDAAPAGGGAFAGLADLLRCG
jgi:ATP-dependent RNA helicase SUPV3L1/SUV3